MVTRRPVFGLRLPGTAGLPAALPWPMLSPIAARGEAGVVVVGRRETERIQ